MSDASLLNPLALAYVGDAVHDLFVRTHAARSGTKVAALHKRSVASVNCEAQARSLASIMEELDEEELAIVKRARNAHSSHPPPHGASREAYAKSTALEALLGFLHLSRRDERLNYILNQIIGNETGE